MIRAALIIAAIMLPGLAFADGWDAFGPDGSYQGRISGESERGLPSVIGSKGAPE